MPPAIEVTELTRSFKGFVAVNRISFRVEPGEVFGFLGPNGAGKTTTVRMLCTLTRPDSGTARVAGHDIAREQDRVRRSIGIIFQDPSLDDRLTAAENLRFHAMVYGVPKADLKRRIAEGLEWMELAGRASDLVRNFSGGMKRRLEICRGLLHEPQVFFLDEPTLGLDPQTRTRIWERLLQIRRDRGTTLFLTTHYMDEAEFCDRIAIIDRGEIIALDTPAALKARVQGDIIRLKTQDNPRAVAEITARYQLKPTRPTRNALEPTADDGTIHLEVQSGAEFLPRLIRELSIPVLSVTLQPPTLDDVFLKLTGREIRDEEASGRDRLKSTIRRMGRAAR